MAARVPSHGSLFVNVPARHTGIDFVYQPIPEDKQGHLIYSSSTAGGICIGDYDGDGLGDLYLTQPFGPDRLYRNLGDFRFADATAQLGIANTQMWSTGATFFDVDNDGDLDLYVCGYDCPNRLYVNQGDGTFSEQAERFGLDFRGASIMLAVADYDRDGDLDGYLVTNRLSDKGPRKYSITRRDGQWTVDEAVRESKDVIFHPGLGVLPINAGQYDHLFCNQGDGTFTDVSRQAGIKGNFEGLSATWSDFDGNGYSDLYVANDNFGPDQLWMNNGDGTFSERADESLPHTPWTSMGCDSADINNDGKFDLLATDMSATTHYRSKLTMGHMDQLGWFLTFPRPRQYMRNALYLNTGTHRFMEVAHMTGLADTDWTWSVRLADLDNDGWVDLFVTNGMTRDFNNSDLMRQASTLSGGAPMVPETIPFWTKAPKRPETNLAFRNLGQLQFHRIEQSWGLGHHGVSFGAAAADLDGDGDLDLVVNNFEEAPSIFKNRGSDGHCVAIRLKGTLSNRFGIDATIRIQTASGQQARYLNTASGFMSAGEPLLHFGLGSDQVIDRLAVHWPSGHIQTFQRLPADRLYTITEPSHAVPPMTEKSQQNPPRFRRGQSLDGFVHREAEFDDFERQPLLPNKLSQLGPGMAWGDVDGDGADDLFVGGAKGQAGQLHLNRGSGRWVISKNPPWDEDMSSEDMGAVFVDADRDGDLDLYVVSGGVECEPHDPTLRDRLYLNDGQASFTHAPPNALPDLRDSGSIVAASDFDADGDVDLFVGGRSVPGQYPLTPNSRLLRNQGGRFRDVTDKLAPGLRQTGLVTSAIWSDVDSDGSVDLLVTHEWGPVKLYQNEKGRLVEKTRKAGLSQRTGWWNGIAAGDVDNDGDMDYAVSNFGLNTKYHPTIERPVRIHYGSFDDSGKSHIVEAQLKGKWLPVRGKSCSQNAMPFLREKFRTFHEFAIQELKDIYTLESLASAETFEVTTLESGLLMNDGTGRFSFRPLPRLAQNAPAFGVALEDVDGDGNRDLYIVQNFFSPQPETGRMDGGVSLLLMGTGTGDFQPMWPDRSGLVVPHDAKSLTHADVNDDGWVDFVIGSNDGPLISYENQRHPKNRVFGVRLTGVDGNLKAVGARVMLLTTDNRIQVAEVASGGSYLSQSSATLMFGLGAEDQVSSIKVRWPDGTGSEFHPEPNQRQLHVRW